MKTKIILSYRRLDSEVITGRIRDKLASHYGEDGVFMDTESIPLGFDYRKQIKDALLKNKVFIAVIGPKWLGGTGREARINEENDPVRIEVETALQQGLPIIPVLVSGATIPTATELPQSLQALCYLNGTEVDGGGDFHLHMGRVIQAIDHIVKASEAAPSRPTRKWPLLALGAIGCLILAAIGIWAYPSISGYVKSAVTRVAPYIDQDFYYKLSTEFRGSDMKLDVINGGPNDNLTQLEPDQNVSGQYWRFLANADGTFRLTTLFRGPNMCLDIFNDGPNNNQPHLAECANVSGQLWTLTKTSKPVENAAKHD